MRQNTSSAYATGGVPVIHKPLDDPRSKFIKELLDYLLDNLLPWHSGGERDLSLTSMHCFKGTLFHLRVYKLCAILFCLVP